MLKALGKRVIVKKIEEAISSENGATKNIIIQVNDNKHFKAVVIHAGSEVDAWVSEDETVILPAHTGTPIEEKGEKYLVIYEDQILAVVRG